MTEFNESQVFVEPGDIETTEALGKVCGGHSFLTSIFVANNGEVAGDVTVQGVQSVIDSVERDSRKHYL